MLLLVGNAEKAVLVNASRILGAIVVLAGVLETVSHRRDYPIEVSGWGLWVASAMAFAPWLALLFGAFFPPAFAIVPSLIPALLAGVLLIAAILRETRGV
jgi:apolipoprotein N-acyltransferase